MQNQGWKSALSRRAFVGKLASGAAGAAVAMSAGAAGAAVVAPREREQRAEAEPQWVAPVEPEVSAEELAVRNAPPGSIIVEPESPAPWELLRPLGAGSSVGHGWRVVGLSAVVDGSSVLTLENERGRSHRVHICRNDGRPQGLVFTNRFDLVVMNGGQGDLPTEEGLAQAVAEVAHVLAANEANREHAALVTALLSQAEREKQFGGAAKLR